MIFSCLFQGNKGAVTIRMDIAGLNVCFVNCHLAAHLKNVGDRIQVVARTVLTVKHNIIKLNVLCLSACDVESSTF